MGKAKGEKQLQEGKKKIWKWIKFREKSDKHFNKSTKREKTKKRISYFPRYHKGRNKGQEKRVGIKIKN